MVDSVLVVAAGLMASFLYRGTDYTITNFSGLVGTYACYLLPYLIGFKLFHTYSGVLRYSSFVDLSRVAKSNFLGVFIIFAVRHFTPVDSVLVPLSWQVLVIGFFLSIIFMWALRIGIKYMYDVLIVGASAQKVFIYGVKDGGVALAKSIRTNESQYVVAGFVSAYFGDTHPAISVISTQCFY